MLFLVLWKSAFMDNLFQVIQYLSVRLMSLVSCFHIMSLVNNKMFFFLSDFNCYIISQPTQFIWLSQQFSERQCIPNLLLNIIFKFNNIIVVHFHREQCNVSAHIPCQPSVLQNTVLMLLSITVESGIKCSLNTCQNIYVKNWG